MAVILQTNANAVLHEAVKIMVGYLWHILAVLFRSGYKQAQRLESSRGKRATYFWSPLYYRPLLLDFEVGHLSVMRFYGFCSLQGMQHIILQIQVAVPEKTNC